ncbi:MAG: phytoene/squalene synthase family protein [Chloroflexota bacterium]
MIRAKRQPWEIDLLMMAYEGTTSASGPLQDHKQSHEAAGFSNDDPYLLQAAYGHCEEITAQHSRSFHLASGLLPTDKRQATRALYAFCRITDDIVDGPGSEAEKEQKLRQWQRTALSINPPSGELTAVAWAKARQDYQVPVRYAEQLIEGLARDLHQTRYNTFADLATYCYGAASTVGLMSMHIVGFRNKQAISYAVKLGLALQMTNILRDVGEDWQRGRLYLPLDELAHYNLSEADIGHGVGHGVVDDRWRQFMRFQIARTRQLYEEAWPGINLLQKDGRFAITVAADVYRAILEDIENHDYDVFNRRAHVTTLGKLGRLPRLWWQSR